MKIEKNSKEEEDKQTKTETKKQKTDRHPETGIQASINPL